VREIPKLSVRPNFSLRISVFSIDTLSVAVVFRLLAEFFHRGKLLDVSGGIAQLVERLFRNDALTNTATCPVALYRVKSCDWRSSHVISNALKNIHGVQSSV
jgi:hypothetical protein